MIAAMLAGILLLAAGGAWGWFYYQTHFSVPEPPLQQAQRTPRRQAVAAIVLVAPPNTAQPSVSSQPASPESTEPPQPTFMLPWDALDEFHKDTEKGLVAELGSSFPDLNAALSDENNSGTSKNPIFSRTVFQLLETSRTASPENKPTLLLATDLTATHLWCDVNHVSAMEAKPSCPDLQADLAKQGLALHYDELGGGFYYRRELLWRVWENYPDSPPGEQAFVILLEDGWDPSGTCAKGGDQTREVIRRGEEFLRTHPASPRRAAVTYLVAEAYASWWSLSQTRSASGLADYVDPKDFQEGADAARLKAIEYFERLPALAPDTKFDKYARGAAKSLGDKEILQEPRFFCVYD